MPIKTQTKPLPDLRKMIHLIYGPPGSGKTTLASQFPGLTFLATEPGLGHVACNRYEYADGTYVIKTWEDLLAAARELVNAKVPTIAIDTVGNACVLAEDYICRKAGEDYKSDGKLGYGKGSAMIANELRRLFVGLASTGIGLVFIAHSMTRTISTRTGEIQKTVPFIPCDNKTFDLYNLIFGMVDLAVLLDSEPDGTRILRTKPGATFDAKDREARLPEIVKMPKGDSAHDFATLYKAFYGAEFVNKEEPANQQSEKPAA